MIRKFCENFEAQQYPSHLISFRKQDLLNIKAIKTKRFREVVDINCSSSYLSKLENLGNINFKICQSFIYLFLIRCFLLYLDLSVFLYKVKRVKLEGLSSLKSLKLILESIEGNSFGNLNSLKQLNLSIESEINNDMIIKLLEICPNIEKLHLSDTFSNINLDYFVNLKNLSLYDNLMDDFNFDLFKNICNQLEELEISFINMNDEIISKLLYGHNFPNLSKLNISCSNITRLEKRLFDGFPMLQSLKLSDNRKFKTIDRDTFSNSKNLTQLDFFHNNLSELDAELFSCLKNLEKLDLSYNKLTHFDLKIMDYFVNIKEIYLRANPIVNKEEIMGYYKQSKIKFKL